MSRRLAASVAVLCIAAPAAIAQPPAKLAPRRPVAVVDLTLGKDPRAQELGRELFGVLSQHAELEPLEAISVGYAHALLDPPADDDEPRLTSALHSLRNAEERLAKFDSGTAQSAADTGMAFLLEVSPPAAAPLYAQLSFVRAQAFLGEHKPDEAARAFSLAWAITPDRVLDPNQLFPEVIDAYKAAKPHDQGTIDVRGTGEVWVDGVAYGAAPRKVTVARGRHIVQLTGLDRYTRGDWIDVDGPDPIVKDILDAPAADDVKIRRARVALAHASDTVERASTMGRLAKLIGVGDALLISQQDGKLMVQAWRDRAPGFTRNTERGNRSALELLSPLSPPPPAKEKEPPPIVIPEEPAWYRQRRVQVGVGLGVVAVVVAAVLWARSGVDTQVWGGNIGGLQ